MRQHKRRFLEHFRVYGNISEGAIHAGVPRSTIYRWQEHDNDFIAAFREAEIQATEALESEARRRAVDGLRRLKFDKGAAILDPATGEPYTELEYSDTLLIFLLKARAPQKYRDNVAIEHTGPGGTPQRVEVVYTDTAPHLLASAAYGAAADQG